MIFAGNYLCIFAVVEKGFLVMIAEMLQAVTLFWVAMGFAWVNTEG